MADGVVIVGASGFAREVLDIFVTCREHKQDLEVLGFIVDEKYGRPGDLVNDKPILGDFSWLAERAKEVAVCMGVGDPGLRLKLVTRCRKLEARYCGVIHPQCLMTKWMEIGTGTVIAAGCIFTNHIVLGDFVQINLACTIGHDVKLGDFATLAPGVNVSGNVTIGVGAYVGTGANIIEKVTIGDWSVIGAGATIIKDVPPNTTVVGVPGRIVRTSTSRMASESLPLTDPATRAIGSASREAGSL